MFYCWDLSTLLSILTTFMAFTKRFLMSSFIPSSCLIVFPRYVNSTVVGRSSLFALISGFSVLFWVRVKTLRCSDVPILPVTTSDKISEKKTTILRQVLCHFSLASLFSLLARHLKPKLFQKTALYSRLNLLSVAQYMKGFMVLLK